MVSENVAYQLQNAVEEVEIDEAPVKWCTVTLSDVISRGNRLEASVYDVEAKRAREIIENGIYPCIPLLGDNGIIDKAFYPNRFKRIYCDKRYGVEFFSPSQITDLYPKSDKYISPKTNCNMDELRLKNNTLLLTRSGTIGNVSLVSKTMENKVFSDDVIRVTFKNPYDLGYTYTFLKSKLGNIVLQTNNYGAVITHIEPEQLQNVQIPNAPKGIKEEIHQLIIDSYALRDSSNKLLDEATALLIQELKLPPIDEITVDDFVTDAPVETFQVRLSQLNKRVDASYHVPIVKAIVKLLKENAKEVTTISDGRISKQVILPGRFKRVYVDEGHGRVFIGGKQLGELDPTNKKYLSIAQHGDRIEQQLELHKNMTLITCSGTIGKVTLVGKHWENWTANQHIIRVVPVNDEIAGYLSVFLSSEYGYHLITRFTYGAVIDEIDATHVRQIPIPLLKNRDVQDEINKLALQANEKRYEAYLLEQKALNTLDHKVLFAK